MPHEIKFLYRPIPWFYLGGLAFILKMSQSPDLFFEYLQWLNRPEKHAFVLGNGHFLIEYLP